MTEERYTYEIDKDNALRVWDNELPNELGAPFLHQPQHPDGRDWVNKAEVEGWVADFIEELLQVPLEEPEVIDAEIVEELPNP